MMTSLVTDFDAQLILIYFSAAVPCARGYGPLQHIYSIESYLPAFSHFIFERALDISSPAYYVLMAAAYRLPKCASPTALMRD